MTHFGNCIHPQFRARAVGRHSVRLDLQPDKAAMGHTEVEVAWLCDNRGVGTPPVDNGRRTDASILFVSDCRHDHVTPQVHGLGAYRSQHTRGQAALHVIGAATIEAVAFDTRRKGISHAGHAHGVGVRIEHQGAAPTGAPYHANDIRAPRGRFVHSHIQVGCRQPISHIARNLSFTGGAWDQIRVDRVNGDQIREERDQFIKERHG